MIMQKLDNYTKSFLESFSDKVFCAVFGTITIVLMLFLSTFVGISPAFAAKSVNTISGEVTISPSLNVTIPSSTVSLNLNPLNTDFDSSNLNGIDSVDNTNQMSSDLTGALIEENSQSYDGNSQAYDENLDNSETNSEDSTLIGDSETNSEGNTIIDNSETNSEDNTGTLTENDEDEW